MEMTEKVMMQRAAIMGLLTGLLEDEEEKSIKDVKVAILQCLNTITEFGCRVEDYIEDRTFMAAIQFCEEERAVLEVDRILNG